MRKKISVVLMAVLLAIGGTAYAATDKTDRSKNALRKMQLIQQQLASEKAQLEKEKEDLAKRVSDLTNDAEKGKDAVAAESKKKNALARELDVAQKERAKLEESLKDARNKLDELSKMHQETLQALSQRDSQKKSLESTVARQVDTISSCESKNLKLYELNAQILSSYKDKGIVDALLHAEPLTQIKTVEIENLLQEYRDKIDSQKIERHSSSN